MGKKQQIPMCKQLAFVALAVAVAWVCVELIALTVWWLHPPSFDKCVQFFYRPHAYRAFEPVPLEGEAIEILPYNCLGLRGRAVSITKPRDTIRVLCLGGSTTYGTEATASYTYPARMERLLRQHYRREDFEIEVLNAGISASVSLESLIYLQTRLLNFKPDVAIFHHVINDAGVLIAGPGFRSDYSHARRTLQVPPPRRWEYSPFLSWTLARRSLSNPFFPAEEANLWELIATRPRVGPWPKPVRQAPLAREMVAAFERNLRSFVHVARGNQVIPVVSTEIYRTEISINRPVNAAVERLNLAVRDVAARELVGCIDFGRAMVWNPKDFADECHLKNTAGGLGRKAQLFADHLIEHQLIERALENQRKGAKRQ